MWLLPRPHRHWAHSVLRGSGLRSTFPIWHQLGLSSGSGGHLPATAPGLLLLHSQPGRVVAFLCLEPPCLPLGFQGSCDHTGPLDIQGNPGLMTNSLVTLALL